VVTEVDLERRIPNQRMDATSMRETAIFSAARRLRVEERAAYLDGACAGDALLRRQIEELLEADETAGGFLSELAAGAGGPVRAGAELDLGATLIMVPSKSEQPGDTIDRYKLMENIGEGGFGVVYVAEQKEPVKRRVALKIIKLGMDTKAVVARFEAERQALAMMDHPNIAKVLDAGTTQTGRPYFVMELVRGIRITDYCDQANLSTRERLDLFIKVCQAIQHAHQKGIVHRDIKPSNILVTLHDGVPVPKVIDFGIAKATEGRLTDHTVYTQLHQFIGKPAYMSPEQAEMSGLDIDTRSDIYSLGVLLYELLVGSTPFDAQELMAVGLDKMRQTIREQEPVRPSTRLATLAGGELTTMAKRRSVEASRLAHLLRGDLDWIVMKCLEKDRSRRYETANGLAADLKRHLNNEPVVARPPSAVYRFQKALHRNRLAFTAAAAVAAALVLGLSASTWLFIRESKAHNRAVAAERQQSHEREAAQTAQANEAQQRRRAKAGEQSAQRLLYAANMNLAQQAWEQNHVGRVRQLLEATAACPQRGFEWNYWQRQTHLELLTLKGHGAPIRSVAFSPNGQRLVTGSEDQTAKVWEAASGKELLTLKGHRAVIWSVAFSPDGHRIVTGSWDATAKVWDVASGKELLTLKGHGAGVSSVAFSPDGQRIVTGGYDQIAKVWDAASGKELLTLKGHGAGVSSAAFSPNGQRIVTGSDDQTAKVWEAAGGKELLTLKGHSAPIWSVAFSSDGLRLVTGSEDQTAMVWEAAGGKELLTLNGHSAPIWSVAFSPDGQRIVTGSYDATAMVWEAADGKELLTLKGHVAEVSSVAFSTDGQRILTGSLDRTAKAWEAASGKELLTLKGHSDGVFSVAFSPDGQRIITGSADQTAKVWEAVSGKELLTLKGHSAGIRSVAFSPDAQRIATGSADQTAKVWEAASGNELLTLKGHIAGVLSVAFSPDGQRIATGSQDQTAKVWEAATVRQVTAWQREEEAATERLAILGREQAAVAEHERALLALDPGAIKQWLVLAPIAFEGRSGAAALQQEQIPQEGDLRARAGERVKVGQSERVWKVVQLEDYLIDFNQLLGEVTEHSVAYAFCYIQSEAQQTGLLMKVGSDDQAKVYLNGREIYRREEGRTYVADQDVAAGVDLKAGLNVLVFKVVNGYLDWKGSVRFTDAAGQPVKGLRATLTPP
jgi:WD40 repeat protein/serine/threonine protein kinase